MANQPQSARVVEFGPFRLDKALGSLSKHGTTIRLRGMPLKILQHLAERPGELVSREELQHLLWNGTGFGDFEQGLNSAVNVVRRTLSDSAEQPRYIETVPGQGYRFIAPIHLVVGNRETDPSSAAMDSRSTVAEVKTERESAPETREMLEERKAAWPKLRWYMATAMAIVALSGVAWWTWHSRPPALTYGMMPSANALANYQFELAMNFLAVQNDIPSARKTFKRAVDLDPEFSAARLQYTLAIVIEILNGYTNDESLLYQAEEELHKAERVLPGSDGLLLAAQAAVYLAQGRLDLVPLAKIEEQWRQGGNPRNPVWLVILRILRGQTEQPIAILRAWLEGRPLDNPPRMFLGEALRIQGDVAGAIESLQRAIQQGPGHPTAAWFLTMAYLDDGKPSQARALLEGMRPGFEKNYMWRHAWAMLLAAEGKRNEALEAMDESTLKFAKLTWSVTSTTADFYALLGDHSRAIEWLQFAIARGDERVSYFRRNPRLSVLRKNPRFQSVLNAVEARRK